MTRVDTLLFDIGGVVIYQHDTSAKIRDRLQMDSAVFDKLWFPMVKRFGSGALSEEEFWQVFTDNGAARPVHAKDDLFGETMRQTLEVYHAMLADITRLGQQGYRLAVLSDTNAPHAAVLRNFHVYDPFGDNVFLSHEIGIRKPAREAYEYVIQQLGVQNPARILFMDDRQSNLTPAQEVGMCVLLAPGLEKENRAALQSAIADTTLP